MIDYTETIDEAYGKVEFVKHPHPDEVKNKVSKAALELSLGTWLITAPPYHPLWSQYMMSIISLREHPDLPPAHIKFDGATHELMVLALNPERGPYTVEMMHEYCKTGTLPFLQPVNIAEQFECTDDEIRQVAWLAARGIVRGILNPETGDAPERTRESWLAACVKTLAHIRGEEHSAT